MAKWYYFGYYPMGGQKGEEKQNFPIGSSLKGINDYRKHALNLAYKCNCVVHIYDGDGAHGENLVGSIRIDSTGPHYYTKDAIRTVRADGSLGADISKSKKPRTKSAWSAPYY